MKKAIVYTDGSYSGSTGKMGYGVHFEDGSGDLHGEIKKCNLCFVIDFNCGEIVTAYWNEATDLHETLDMRKYAQ